MKTLLLTASIFLCICRTQAQITLEDVYPPGTNTFKLDVSGVKYVKDSSTAATFDIKIYNTNHSLFKSINFSNPYPSYGTVRPFLYSENLFDLDSGVEFAVDYIGNPGDQRFVIFNANGTILFNKANAYLSSFINAINQNGPYSGIIPTPDGTKMFLQFVNPSATKVYSLPGNLPCWACSEGSYTGNKQGSFEGAHDLNSQIFPNPSSAETEITYQLPEGCKQAVLSVYSLEGKLMKTFTITSDFDNIVLSNEDLPSGNYFYNIQTSTGLIDGKQFVIVQ